MLRINGIVGKNIASVDAAGGRTALTVVGEGGSLLCTRPLGGEKGGDQGPPLQTRSRMASEDVARDG